jgi:tetratricopeptide (TPR) repeat protein
LIRFEESRLGIRRSLLIFLLVLSGGLASLANAEGLAALVDDPWLSEQGPAVATPVEVASEQVIAAWRTAPEAAFARTAALRRVRLELGMADLVGPAHVILTGATDEDPEIYSTFALDLAPGTPLFRWAHVRALFASGDIGAGTRATVEAVWSIVGSLAAQLWLIENFSLIALMVVLGAPLGFILLSAIYVFPHAAHDVGDLLGGRGLPVFARSAALAALLLLPLVLGEGVIGFALALFALAFAYGKSHQRQVLVMAATLLVIGLHPLAQFVSVATTLVDRDPIAQSVMAVVAGLESNADVERLESVVEEDPAAAHALVVRARRYGLEEQARVALEALGARYPGDGHVLAALGSIEMRREQTEAAIGLFERAVPQVDSATLLFDLSQAYAAAFRMEESEATLSNAQRLDAAKVASLSSLGDARMVADLQFPVGLLYDRFQSQVLSQGLQFGLVRRLAPGRIGESWFMTAGAFALVVLFGILFANRFDHSSQCGRCGHRICTRCEETVWSEEICEDCHHLFQYPDSTDPSLRMARLQALSKRGAGIDRIVLAASLLIPGVAGFASRRPDFAMFGLLLFGWIVAWVVWPLGVFDDPLLMGDAAWLCFAIPGVLAVFSYSGIVIASLVARKNL